MPPASAAKCTSASGFVALKRPAASDSRVRSKSACLGAEMAREPWGLSLSSRAAPKTPLPPVTVPRRSFQSAVILDPPLAQLPLHAQQQPAQQHLGMRYFFPPTD